MVLLILGFGAQLTSIFCIAVHYCQHFRCRKQNDHKSTVKSPSTTPKMLFTTSASMHTSPITHPKKCLEHFFHSIDGEDFDIFPISFLLYLTLASLLCTLSLYNYIMNVTHNPLLITSQIRWSQRTHIQTQSITDYLLCYLILILLLFESIFHFRRYYITYFTSKKFFNPSRILVLKRFSLYCIPFALLFLCQIHLYYWLFPILIAFHFIFNIFCTYHFCHILIERYSFYKSQSKGAHLQRINEQFLITVYTIRRASICSIVFSTLYLCIFTIGYDVNIANFIGLLYIASNVCFMLNFVRNRFWFANLCKCNETTHTNAVELQKVTIVSSMHNTELKNTENTPKLTPNTSDKLTPNTVMSDVTDITPVTDTDLCTVDNDMIIKENYATPHSDDNLDNKLRKSNTNTPMSPMSVSPVRITNSNNSKSNLLMVPSPIDIKTTVVTTENNSNSNSNTENDIEYQKWYTNMHKKSSLTPTTPNPKKSLVIPSLRISIMSKFGNGNTNETEMKTPLTDCGENMYDMSPINIENKDSFSDEEPSVNDINMNTKQIKKSQSKSQSPMQEIFMGILKKASSLVKSHSNGANKCIENDKSECQQRVRSYSDPIMPKPKLSAQSNPNMENDESAIEFEHSFVSHSVNINSGNLPKLCDNNSAPNVHSLSNNIRQFKPSNDEKLWSVLVSHGLCSRSSLKF